VKALFLTTGTADCMNHVRAWDSAYPKAEHVTFNPGGIRNDWQLVEAAERVKPDIIFYIGAAVAPGNPKPPVFRQLRAIAPSVNIVSDAADTPWHPTLRMYRRHGCFDLQVSIDGADRAPEVDVVTLTPIDATAFNGESERNIRCGFSGGYGKHSERGHIIRCMDDFGGLTLRKPGGSYESHVAFLKRCWMTVNVSYTGSGLSHHIKGRVLEAGWAGCALLESEGSPIGDWFPEGCWIPYDGPRHALSLVQSLTDAEIDDAAQKLAAAVRYRYTARMIYGAMIEGAKRSVDTPIKVTPT